MTNFEHIHKIDGHYTDYAYCEIKGHKCHFVENDTITENEWNDMILWWLKQNYDETVNNSDELLTI